MNLPHNLFCSIASACKLWLPGSRQDTLLLLEHRRHPITANRNIAKMDSCPARTLTPPYSIIDTDTNVSKWDVANDFARRAAEVVSSSSRGKTSSTAVSSRGRLSFQSAADSSHYSTSAPVSCTPSGPRRPPCLLTSFSRLVTWLFGVLQFAYPLSWIARPAPYRAAPWPPGARRFYCRFVGCEKHFSHETHTRRHERRAHRYWRRRPAALPGGPPPPPPPPREHGERGLTGGLEGAGRDGAGPGEAGGAGDVVLLTDDEDEEQQSVTTTPGGTDERRAVDTLTDMTSVAHRRDERLSPTWRRDEATRHTRRTSARPSASVSHWRDEVTRRRGTLAERWLHTTTRLRSALLLWCHPWTSWRNQTNSENVNCITSVSKRLCCSFSLYQLCFLVFNNGCF